MLLKVESFFLLQRSIIFAVKTYIIVSYVGLITIAFTGNVLALYTLLAGKGGLTMKRSKIIFLHITLADMLVTLFPILGDTLSQRDYHR